MQHLFSHGLHSENWNTTTFVDFATLHRGYDLPVHARTEGAVPIIGSNGITGHHNEAKITGPGVVTGRSGSIGISHYVEQDFWPLNTSLYVCDFHGNFPLFVHYFFEWFNFRKYATGTGVPTLNRNLVHRDSIKVPHETEQKEIARTLAVIDTDLALHESKRVTLRDLFKMTLNKLMTRDILVVDLDIEMKKVHA
ncbi:MAG: restriction endonuclease subunit S [Candidatus Krumholzibacteria bacterium]|nr:restriction endonuclease subunit S [Candidatus Krumholzibacteria bacterium]